MKKTAKKKYDRKTALLVDDDPDFLAQIQLGLQNIGFKVMAGESQAEGEKLVKAGGYDLAVFDLMMENEDSGFILSYKSKKTHPGVPVIMATSVTNDTGMQFDASTEESRSWLKADVIIDKNLRFEQLEHAIDSLLP